MNDIPYGLKIYYVVTESADVEELCNQLTTIPIRTISNRFDTAYQLVIGLWVQSPPT